MTDQEIVELLLMKEEAGLVTLARKYEKLILYIINTILGFNQRDAEECLNDTYMKIWRNIERYDLNKASLKTYIKVIARNTAVNRLRDVSRKNKDIVPLDYSEAAVGYMMEAITLEDHIVLKEDVRRLQLFLQKLKPRDKELIIRKFFYMQSSKQIAKKMSSTVSAVDSKLSRLRVTIQKELGKEW